MSAYDEWLSSFDRVNHVVDELMSDINERSRLTRNNVSSAKLTTIIRKKLNSIPGDVASLESSLDRMTRQSRITEKEASRRLDMVANLKNRLAEVNMLFKKSGNVSEDVRDNLFNNNNSSSNARGGRTWGRVEETDETRGMGEQDLLMNHQDIMREQDASLDALSEVISRQREIGISIADEVDNQNDMLEDLNFRADQVGHRMKRETRHIDEVAEKAQTGGWICIVLLIIAIVVLLLI